MLRGHPASGRWQRSISMNFMWTAVDCGDPQGRGSWFFPVHGPCTATGTTWHRQCTRGPGCMPFERLEFML